MHSKGKTCQHREALRQTLEKVGVVRPLRHLRRDLPKLLIFVEWLRTQHRDRESEHLRPGYCPFRLLRIHGALFSTQAQKSQSDPYNPSHSLYPRCEFKEVVCGELDALRYDDAVLFGFPHQPRCQIHAWTHHGVFAAQAWMTHKSTKTFSPFAIPILDLRPIVRPERRKWPKIWPAPHCPHGGSQELNAPMSTTPLSSTQNCRRVLKTTPGEHCHLHRFLHHGICLP